MASFYNNGKKIKYKLRLLCCDGQPIDQVTALENLKIFDEFMRKHNLKYTLTYGTCLGAVRDKGFIAHDEDCDLAVKEDAFNAILDNYEELKSMGLEIARQDPRGHFSLWRNNEYMDIIEFKDYSDDAYLAVDMYQLPKKFLDEIKYIDFKDTKLPVPKDAEEFLLYEYGETWTTPIKYEEKVGIVWISKLRALIKYFIPLKIKMKLYEKSGEHYRKEYNEKMAKYLKDKK